MAPVLILGLGREAAYVLARIKGLWERLPGAGTVLAVGGPAVGGLTDDDVAPFERDGHDLPHASLATAIAGLGGEPEVVIVADLAEPEAASLSALATEMRRGLGPAGRIAAALILPGDAEPEFLREPAAKALGAMWPVPGKGSLLDRLYLVEEADESGKAVSRDALREALALRLAIEGSDAPAAATIRERSDALGDHVRSLGALALRYPCRAVAELAAARLGAALVEGWCGQARESGGPLPPDLPIDEEALEFASLAPDSVAEIEAFLDELVWSLRGRFPQLPALAAALPAELSALEQIQFSASGPDRDAEELDVFVREPRPRSVLEGARERLNRQVQAWQAACEAELANRCKPLFLEGGGLARGMAFLDELATSVKSLEASLDERDRISASRLADAQQKVDAAIAELGAAARKTLFKSQAVTTAFAGCRSAALGYLTTRAEAILLADFRATLEGFHAVLSELQDRIGRITGVLTYVQHGLEDRAVSIAEGWRGPNLLDPGDPEQAYRDVVGTLPDEEAHLASLHEDFVAGGSVLDLPIAPGDEQHLVDRLHERALLRFPELLEATFGQGLAQRLPTQALRAERLAGAIDRATPLLRLGGDPEKPLPGKAVTVLAHEPAPPQALRDAIKRLDFPAANCAEVSKKLADHLFVLSERGGIGAADLRSGLAAIMPPPGGTPESDPGMAPPEAAPDPSSAEPALLAEPERPALLAEPEAQPLLPLPRPSALLGPGEGQTLDPAAIDAALDQMLGEVDSTLNREGIDDLDRLPG